MKRIGTVFPCIIWLAFLIIGIVQQRWTMCIVSVIFLGISILMFMQKKKMKNSAEKMWRAFALDKPEMKEYPYQIWTFLEGPEFRKNIIARILDGEVTGESYSIDFFDANQEVLPEVGRYNVICDGRGQAYCIVKTINITTTTFGAVNSHLAQVEGCKDVDQWKKYNKNKYERICEKLDIEFNRGLPLFFEEFEIVYK